MKRPTPDELRAVYAAGGLRAAIALEMERGCPTKAAARSRIMRFGVHKKRYTRRDWTMPEIAKMRAMWNAGVPSEEIGKRLGRTAESVQHRAHHDPSCPPRVRKPWTPAQEKIIEQAVDQLIEHFSARFDRTDGAIRSRVHKLAMRSRKRKPIRDVGGMATDMAARPEGRTAA